MKITWDERKRIVNLANRGLDFGALDIEFFEGAELVPTREGRFLAIGPFDGTILSVVFKPLGSEAISVVSMRRASRKERSIR